MKTFLPAVLVFLCLSHAARAAGGVAAWELPDPRSGTAGSFEEMATVVDLRPTVRESLGVRSAHSTGEGSAQVELGLSTTDAAADPNAYRVISLDDPNYAYEKFVRPVAARMVREVEVAGAPEGAMKKEFLRTVVDLDLPYPLVSGVTYHVLAQGAGQTMVTGTRTAAGFIHGEKPAARDKRIDAAVLGLRRIEPVGNGILMAEFGPAFSPKGGVDGFKVLVNGKPREVVSWGRRTIVDAYLPVGWPFQAIPRHEVFLQLAEAFADGDRVELEVPESATAGNRLAALDFSDAGSVSPSLKVNQVGYLTESPVKVAYIGRWLGDFPIEVKTGKAASPAGGGEKAFWQALEAATAKAGDDGPAGDGSLTTQGGSALYFPEPPKFRILPAGGGKPVFEGTAKLVHRSGVKDEGIHQVDHSGENVYELDFSEFRVPGEYVISVDGVGRSPAFAVGDDVYDHAYKVQSYGVFAQRSGQELLPENSPWQRVASFDKGIIPTTLTRFAGERVAHDKLPEHVDFRLAGKFQPPPELAALNDDPSLLAYWPLDGSLEDVSGHGRQLQPPADLKPEFVDAPRIMPGGNRAYGPTASGRENALRLDGLDMSAADGITFSFWFRVTGGIKYNGVLIGSEDTSINTPRMQITAGWGMLRGFVGTRGEELKLGRLEDGDWHHVSLVYRKGDEKNPDGKAADGTLLLFIDGVPAGTAKAGSGEIQDLPFVLAGLDGEESGGKFLDEVRVYGRALEPAEIEVLSRCWGERAIAIDARGGHHDAGDYNPRSHLEVARILMNAYEMAPKKFSDSELGLPEAGNGLPDILDEAAWAMRLWPPLQNPDGSVRGGTESDGDPNFIQTVELDTKGDFAYAPDSQATLEFAGTFAQAARIWRALGRTEQADEWLERARRAYDWASANKPPSKDPAEFSARYLSPKAYAAAELLHSTGEPRYAEDFREAAVWAHKPDLDLDLDRLYDQQAAAWAYLQCPEKLTDPALRKEIRAAILRRADEFIRLCDTMGYKFYRHPYAPITWGTGAYPNSIDPVLWAHQLTGDPKYLEWIVRSCDNTLGSNPLGRSYITGLGERPVRAPLHNSRYSHFGEVVPGMHVQGPNQRGDGYGVKEITYPKLQEDFALLNTFADVHFAIAMDEGTIPSQARCMALFGLLRPEPAAEKKPKAVKEQ